MRSRILLAMSVWVAGFATHCHAAQPSLDAVRPTGGQRGTELEVTFSGSRMADAKELLLYYPGIQVKELTAVNDNQVKAKLAIAPDCRLGIHALRMRTATGVSQLRQFNVGPFKEIAEAEPNTDFAKPQPIEMNVTVNGTVDNEDIDYYILTAKKGDRISAEVEGVRLGLTQFDPYVAIMDMGRFELSACDDSALVWQDAVASVIAPADGTYVIAVRESAFGGNGNCLYRLHVGSFPRPTAVLPAGGKPGETLDVKFLGDVTGEIVRKVTLPAQGSPQFGSPQFGLEVQDDRGLAPSPVPFRVIDLENTLEAEPNDAIAQATAGAAPRALNGVIDKPGDVDCFKFAGTQGQVFDIHVYGRRIRSPLDSVLVIHRLPDGAGLASNDDAVGPDSYLRFTVPANGEYAIAIYDHLKKGGVDYAYRVELTPVKPQLSVSLPEVARYQDVTVSVPKGNRMAAMFNASRADFGGPLSLKVDALPAGMAIESVEMAANQSTTPILFTAAADAQPAGSIAPVIASHTDPNTGISGGFRQDSLLVLGDNQSRVWEHKGERMALVLTEECPFKIDIVQPKVPLVRSGSMQLKVVVTRKEGFAQPINLRMLYNPPGVGSSSVVTIPGDQNEGIVQLNANDGAEIRNWKIAVIGSAPVGNGTIEVATQLADLPIAEKYFTFAFQQAATEQGQPTDVVVKVTHATPFEGEAEVQLLGLPAEVTTTPVKMTKDLAELVFKVNTTKNSPAGKHVTLLCNAVVMANGEPIAHALGGGVLRIDQPLPPKPNQAAAPPPPMPAAAPTPAPAEQKPPEKRLTRLEKLRLEREEAKKAGTAPPAEQKPAEPAK